MVFLCAFIFYLSNSSLNVAYMKIHVFKVTCAKKFRCKPEVIMLTFLRLCLPGHVYKVEVLFTVCFEILLLLLIHLTEKFNKANLDNESKQLDTQ